MTNPPPKTMQKTERISGQMGPGRGPHGGGMVGQKSLDFRASGRRLIRSLRPERIKVIAVFVTAVISVALSATGPRVLGRATDIVFAGAIGKGLPSGIDKEQAIDMARARGEEQVADLLTGIDLVPGEGIDFSALGSVLLLVLGLYAASSLLSFC